MAKRKYDISAMRRFVLSWQAAESSALAAEAFGITQTAATTLASKMRKAGVPLKKFSRVAAQLTRSEIDELRRICEESFRTEEGT